MWQKQYKQRKFYWGLKPNPTLLKFLNLIPKGNVLDIGAGEGRNSIFLASEGFNVLAIDKISEGLNKCKNLAKKHNLKIKTKICDIKDFEFENKKYSLILSVASLDFLKKSEIEAIIEKIKKSLTDKGVIYFLVFSTKDPLYKKIKELGLKEIEENTFYMPKYKTYRHFFEDKEIKEYFKDFKIIHLRQKTIKDIGHDKPHLHKIIEIFAQKKKTTT